MKNLSVLVTSIALSIYCSSCIGTGMISQTSGLSQADLSAIPKGSKEVIISGMDGNILYEKVISILIQRGHRIIKEDKERFYILTEGKDVGESTLQRMTISISSSGEATIKSEWMPGQEATTTSNAISGLNITPSWSIAVYKIERSGIAFAEAVAIGKATGGVISFR